MRAAHAIITGTLPAFLVLGATILVSWITGQPEDLFLARTTWSIPVRFAIVTLILMAPIVALPRLVTWAGSFGKDDGIFGRFVKSDVIPHHEFSWYVDLLLRPMQGVGFAMVFAERFLYILEFSTGTSYAVTVIRSTIFAFMMANPLISFFLAFLWTFDDLGVKVYDRRTGEIRLLGGSIGIILPLITGAIGILLLFRRAYVLDAVVDLIGVLMVLYPPYLLFVLAHHEFILERGATILKTLLFDTVETRLRPSQKAIA